MHTERVHRSYNAQYETLIRRCLGIRAKMGEPKISSRSNHLDLRLAKLNEDALHT